MAELGNIDTDDENESDNDDRSSASSNEDNNHNIHNGKMNIKQEESINNNNNHHQTDDVDDDELDRLARINAEFNTNNLGDKPLKPKGITINIHIKTTFFLCCYCCIGTLHTFRPTHLDQYELGTQHGSVPISKMSDISIPKPSYTILARQKLQTSSDISTKSSIYKPQKSTFDMTNNIQWSSMSTTTDLLF